VPITTSLLSLTSCKEDSFVETTMIFNEENIDKFLEKNHTVFEQPLAANANYEQIKDYFFTQNRIPGKNLTYLAISAFAEEIDFDDIDKVTDLKIKIGYNSHTCYAKLESDITTFEDDASKRVIKSGTYSEFSFYPNGFSYDAKIISSITIGNEQRYTKYEQQGENKVILSLSEISSFILYKDDNGILELKCNTEDDKYNYPF
jgi:hypothetical protein